VWWRAAVSPLSGTLRVALYRDFEARVDEASEELELAPHETLSRGVEGMLGRFVDAAWAYRFGPATADAIVVSLESRSGPSRLLSQSVRFPAGYPTARLGVDELELRATADEERDGTVLLALRSRRVAYGVPSVRRVFARMTIRSRSSRATSGSSVYERRSAERPSPADHSPP
jgi:hypothetical protein